MSARDRLEALRRLNGRIEGLERQRARTPKEVGRLTRFARALRRERRRLVLEAGGVGRIGSDGGGGRPGHSRCGRESRPRPLDHRAADRGVGEGAAPATRVRAGIGAGVGFGGDRPMSTAAEQLEQHPISLKVPAQVRALSPTGSRPRWIPPSGRTLVSSHSVSSLYALSESSKLPRVTAS